MKKKLYVIQPIHYEYNDESYSEEGLEEAEFIFSDPIKAQQKLDELNKDGKAILSQMNEENSWEYGDEDPFTYLYIIAEVEGDIDV